MEDNKDMKRIKELLEFIVKQKISVIINQIENHKEKKVYQLTGIKGQRELVKITGISAGKISKLWNTWEKEGLLIKEGKKYRKLV